MQKYKVYVLRSKSGKIYIGQSQDTEARLLRHNRHENKATRPEEGWKIIHEEQFETRAQAMKREKFLKTGAGRCALKNKWVLD